MMIFTVLLATSVTSSMVNRPPPPPPPPVDPALQKLIAKYTAIRTDTCNSVVKQVPTMDATDFMAEYVKYTGNNSEAPVIAAATKLLSDPAVATFLALPDSIATADGLDAMMVKCAVMSGAWSGTGGGPKSEVDGTMDAVAPPPYAGAPKGPYNYLAEFAFLGADEEALVDKLLSDASLMRDMLVAGGVMTGHYGEAMQIWTNIQKTSSIDFQAAAASAPPSSSTSAPWDDRTPATVLKRLAVGVACALAVPKAQRNNVRGVNVTYVDPVARYMHFEKYYLAGDLDPAFPVLTTFELSHTVDGDAVDDQMIWLRATLATFRPDLIYNFDYHWRYAESVHTEVQYGDSQCPNFPGVCGGGYQDIPVGGDVCGGRAFWGRFSRKGFGIPTWGATEHAHAAMSSWTPSGWNVMLGAPWPDCWWGDRGGQDFVLETQARVNLAKFQEVLRGGWAAVARDEDPVSGMWSSVAYSANNGKGGEWSALMLYSKKIVAKATAPTNITIPAAEPGIVNKVAALLARAAQPAPPAPAPATSADGATITIAAVSFTSANKSAPVSKIFSFDAADGQQLVSNGCTSSVGPPCFAPASSSVTYDFTSAAAGSFYLTANFSTYHMNQDLYVSVNGAKEVEVGMFYTLGWWKETVPVAVTLAKGANSLVFTRTSGRDVSFKEFVLATKKPDVPPPNGNYTPIPAPPSPPPGAYIEVPAATTCVKQGIEPVGEKDCSHACLALGFQSTGDRARANISGCFVMTTGPYAGNCNYNTNKSATCTPPCTLMGSVVRSLCERGGH